MGSSGITRYKAGKSESKSLESKLYKELSRSDQSLQNPRRKLTLTTVHLLHNSSTLVGSVATAVSSNPSCSSSFQLSPPCSRPSAGHLHGVHGEAALPSRFMPLFPTSAPLLSPGSGCFTTKIHHWSHGALSSPGRPSVQPSAASTLPCAGLLPTLIYIGSRFSTWKNVFS